MSAEKYKSDDNIVVLVTMVGPGTQRICNVRIICFNLYLQYNQGAFCFLSQLTELRYTRKPQIAGILHTMKLV